MPFFATLPRVIPPLDPDFRPAAVANVQAKTRLALERAGGVMVWELSQDAKGEASLLGAIYRTVRGVP